MRRWAWRIFVAVSAALLVGTAALWARAQWRSDTLTRTAVVEDGGPGGRRRWVFQSRRQSLVVSAYRERFRIRFASQARTIRARLAGEAGWRHRAARSSSAERLGTDLDGRPTRPVVWGFGFDVADGLGVEMLPPAPWGGGRASPDFAPAPYDAHVHAVHVAVPWWLLTLAFAPAPLRALWGWRKTRRRPPHACRGCGYDLRATPDPAGPHLATCPECGRPAAPA